MKEDQLIFNYGSLQLDGNDIINVANKNLDRYIKSKGWSLSKSQKFRDSYQRMVDGIRNGTLSRKDNGVFVSTTGEFHNKKH